MKRRKLGNIEVSEVGMGCMAFSHGYGSIPNERYSIEAIRGAYEAGCTFFDTAEVYGPNLARSQRGHNERIVGKALAGVRDDVVIATKLFLDGGFGGTYRRIRRHLDASMDRLQTDYIDLYYLHRMASTPVEEVAEAMGRLIDEGLIGGWGLSQVGVDVISRAQAVTPLTAVQNIYSMVERDVEDEVIPYCAKHGIGLVAFSPVASGLLSGKVRSTAQFERVDDVRTWVPQLSERNLAANRPLVEMLEGFAAAKGCTPAQLSMAWMLAKWDNVVPIPGSKNKGRILENLGAAEVGLTADELAQLERALDGITVYGHRGFAR